MLKSFADYYNFGQRQLLDQYIRYTTPDGVKRERRTTLQMELILNSEYGYSLGVKTHWNRKELDKKDIWLGNLGPRTFEIHLYEGDLENHTPEIRETLEKLKKQTGLYVSIHEPLPLRYNGKPVDLSTTKKSYLENTKECLEALNSLCNDYGLFGFVAHPFGENNPSRDNYRSLLRNLKIEIDEDTKAKMFLENVKYFSTPERMKDAYNLGCELCFDIAHAQILLGSDKLIEAIEDLSPIVRYYHLAGVDKDKHGFKIGLGVISWEKIVPFIRGHAILEVRSVDELDPFEMGLSLGTLRITTNINEDVDLQRILKNEELQRLLKKHGYEIFTFL